MDYIKQLKNKYSIFLGDLPEVERIRSGVIGLDYITCGGFAKGRVVELFGPNGIGKTATCLELCKSYINKGLSAVYIDAERALSYEDLDRLSIDKSSLLIMHPDSAEQAMSFIDDICSVDHPTDLIILDSIPVLEPKGRLEKLNEDLGASEMAIKARFYSSLQGWLLPIIERTGTTLIMVNQVRSSLSIYSSSTSTPGGNALKHLFSYRIELKGNTKIIDESSGAIRTKFICIKNKLGNKGIDVDIDITPFGIDNYYTMFNILKQEQLIVNRGSWFHFTPLAISLGLCSESDTKLSMGIPNTIELLHSNSNLFSTLSDTVISISQSKRSNRLDSDLYFSSP